MVLPATQFTFSRSSGEVELRGGYVFAMARGVLATPQEVSEYFGMVRAHLDAAHVRRLLMDARGQTEQPSAEVRDAAWSWLRRLNLERIAYVVGTEEALKLSRINMTAISSHMPMRAFTSVLEAHRWLATTMPGSAPKPSVSPAAAVARSADPFPRTTGASGSSTLPAGSAPGRKPRT